MNILDYLETEFSSFKNKPFNVVDSAILSQFCMVRCEGLVPPLNPDESAAQQQRKTGFTSKASLTKLLNTLTKNSKQSKTKQPAARFVNLLRAERYSEMFTGLVPERIKSILVALAASPRFRVLSLQDYLSIFDKKTSNQFAAITFVYNSKNTQNEFAYIGFRGTDTSITGWRENFNMAYTSPVPAQAQALRYLETVAPHLPQRLYVGGHSKGGNLALYAALKASSDIQQRIDTVFVHDAPGFKRGAISSEEWARLNGRIDRTIPEESIVGMLMDCPAPARIVKAQEHGFDQHSIFNWDLNAQMNDFSYTEKIADSAEFFDEVFSEWLAQYSDDEAAEIVDALFKAIGVSGITNATELFFGGIKIIPLISKAAQNLDTESGTVLRNALGSLAVIAANQAGRNIGQNVQDASKSVQEYLSTKFSKD